jgi:hypothetical protein
MATTEAGFAHAMPEAHQGIIKELYRQAMHATNRNGAGLPITQ